MSLTSFLTDKEVKEKFAQEFQLPDFNLEKEMIATPLTNHFILLGTAFDYLFRFYLRHLNPKAITKTWVAEYAPEIFLMWIAKHDKPFNVTHVWIDKNKGVQLDKEKYLTKFASELSKSDQNIFEKLQNIIKEAKENYSSFISSGQLTDELIKSAIKLAQLDPIYRNHYLDENIGVIDEKDVEDLRKLISSVNPENFKAPSICLLNPTFGGASQMVGGADADLLIDDTLIDIKTTKFLKFDRKMFNQLIGYYILYKIGGIGELPEQPEIKKLGIYYPRFNEVYAFDISDIIDEDKLTNFIDWFKVKAKNIFDKR